MSPEETIALASRISVEFEEALNFWSDIFTVKTCRLDFQTDSIVTCSVFCKSTYYPDLVYEFAAMHDLITGETQVSYGPEVGQETEITPEFLYFYLWEESLRNDLR